MLIRVLLTAALIACHSSLSWTLSATFAQEETTLKPQPRSSQALLPLSTKAWFSIPNIQLLKDAVASTNFGAMAKDEKLKPFVESFQQQFQAWLNKKNVRLGFKIEQLDDFETGEVCLAGVLQNVGDKPVRGSHGLILLVHVKGDQANSEKLLKQVTSEVLARGAVEDAMQPINGIAVQRLKLTKPKLKRTITTYYASHEGWLVASDNESVFRESLRRLAGLNNLDPKQSLAAQEAFNAVMQNTTLGEQKSHFRWYIDPFGYSKLAQAIADEEQIIKKERNDQAELLEKEGFDAFRGLGGQVAFSSPSELEGEVFHRTYLYAPRDKNKAEQQRVFGLFEFKNENKLDLQPKAWVPANASTQISLTWDFKKAFDNIGFLVDAFAGKGTWESTLKSFKNEPAIQVDLRELVHSFGNEIIVFSATEKPITEESEKVAIAVPVVKAKSRQILTSIQRILPTSNLAEIKLLGIPVIEHDTTLEADDTSGELGGLGELGDPLDPEEIEEPEDTFHLFQKRYFAILAPKGDNQEYLVICNDRAYMKKIIQEGVLKASSKNLLQAADYLRIRKSLDKLVQPEKVSFRQFARIDKAIQVNYEMMRQGKMGASKTVLAQLLNRAMTPPDADPDEVRQQQFDASKLPANFDKEVAKYFGPSGWVIETENDGWRLTGCILKKKPLSEVVRKMEQETTR